MSTNKGGHPVDEFVYSHFTTVGEKTASKRWNMRCKYCPNTAKLIMHRDSRCLTHLAKTGEGFCSNAPPEVRAEARRRLMAKGGLEIPESTSDVEISEVGSSVQYGIKKGKSLGNRGTHHQTGNITPFLRCLNYVEILSCPYLSLVLRL
jgi:hypothetical protein